MSMLTATWGPESDPVLDDPDDLYWEDGRPGEVEEYATHRSDTHMLLYGKSGVELRMFPDLIGYVRFDGYMQMWFLLPPCGEPISLDIRDVNASDLDLRAALYVLPIVYRAVIHR